MEELFVPQKIEILAKENGYNNQNEIYNQNGEIIDTPTYQQLIDWFRDTHKLHIKVQWRTFAVKNCDGYYYDFNDTGKNPQDYYTGGDTYYGAMNMAFIKAFELIKK